MKKKTLYIGTCAIIILGILSAIILSLSFEEKHSQYIYEKIEDIPALENELQKYGIEYGHFIYFPAVAGLAGIIILVSAGMCALVILYSEKQDKKIEEIERYCENILNGSYSLDLRDNKEGRFSILKNKVYDITVMLSEKNKRLEQSKKDAEVMLADISHQLKTPITSLNMINEILYMNLPGDQKIIFLDNMQKDLMKIEWLVKTILNIAKLDSKTLIPEKKKINAHDFSKDIKDHFKAFSEINECRIIVENPGDITLLCDKKWTKEALNNIIKNSIEHNAKTVVLKWEQNNLYTQLRISDDGEGIEKEDLPHIFERFYKTKNSKEDSVGLGLAFSKSIIANQDGEIKVKSKKGSGTEFIIKFYENLL